MQERIDEIFNTQAKSPGGAERLRTPVTILFSDIKGSTTYFEQKGDIEGLAMVERHNKLLFPCIEQGRGRIVKTIGDAIMALFDDPVDAIHAAVRMQTVLHEDARSRPDSDQIHIRIGIHTGLGLIQGDDVFGDVVNVAARVQSQSEPEQILITDSLLSAAETAGCLVGRLGRAKMKGKDEPIDIYAIGWSPAATQQLIDDIEERFEGQLLEVKRAQAELEETLDRAREEWREERRRLHAEIERLEESAMEAMGRARSQVAGELQQQMQFKVEAAERVRAEAEEDLRSALNRFEAERSRYKEQMAALEHRLVEAMEQMNNPVRASLRIREQVQARLSEARIEWEAQWEAERARYAAEIERLRRSGPKDPIAEARRMMMERMRAKQEGGAASESAESAAARSTLEQERDALASRVKSLEAQLRRTEESAREDALDGLQRAYEQKLEQADRIRLQAEQELQTVTDELAAERRSAAARIRRLEETVEAAEEAARLEGAHEVRAELEARIEDLERSRARAERSCQESLEEWNLERGRLERQVQDLELNLAQAREMAFKRSSDPTIEELNRLRRHLEEEFQTRSADWEEEKRRLTARIESLEGSS